MDNSEPIEVLTESPPTSWITESWVWAKIEIMRHNNTDPYSSYFIIQHYNITTANRIRFENTEYQVLRIWNIPKGYKKVECSQI